MALDDQRRFNRLEAQVVEILRRLSNQPVRWAVPGTPPLRVVIKFFDNITSTNELIVPAGIKNIWIAIVGAGGGGGASLDSNTIIIQNSTTTIPPLGIPGGGGGAGAAVFGVLKVKAADLLLIIIGKGGKGALKPPIFGDDGTNTSIKVNGIEKAVAVGGHGAASTTGGVGGGTHTITTDTTVDIVEMPGAAGHTAHQERLLADGAGQPTKAGTSPASGGDSLLGAGGSVFVGGPQPAGRGGGGSGEVKGGDGLAILIF